MQGINAKEHQSMLDAFHKFEELSLVIKENITKEEESYNRKGMEDLIGTYHQFKYLLAELESCTKEYAKKKKAVQRVLFKSIRRMNAEMRKRQGVRF